MGSSCAINWSLRAISVGEGLDPPLTYRCRNCHYVAIMQQFMRITVTYNISRLGRVKTLPYNGYYVNSN